MVHIGLNEGGNKEKTYETLSDGEKLWVLSWHQGNENYISVFKKKRYHQMDAISVRIVANDSYDVLRAGSKKMAMEKG
ncbi:hypothetical protein tinsulaeT_08910 [Thalassotalea insulae]|uniref:Uncharacterized protein n=1 Tax=Thalassotalea insulae TaxID=2056778 RepID=A0ABQ6GS84_9GAMM|nr:hypothetical protein [Thalassotalea insulae]GLX77551.1 hypothetical protein tinsulaeT_08910 [Thalassotalea insulae]